MLILTGINLKGIVWIASSIYNSKSLSVLTIIFDGYNLTLPLSNIVSFFVGGVYFNDEVDYLFLIPLLVIILSKLLNEFNEYKLML